MTTDALDYIAGINAIQLSGVLKKLKLSNNISEFKMLFKIINTLTDKIFIREGNFEGSKYRIDKYYPLANIKLMDVADSPDKWTIEILNYVGFLIIIYIIANVPDKEVPFTKEEYNSRIGSRFAKLMDEITNKSKSILEDLEITEYQFPEIIVGKFFNKYSDLLTQADIEEFNKVKYIPANPVKSENS